MLEAELPGAGQTSFTRQQEPLGLGHAVWCARDIVGNEPFALMLPDMLHFGQRGCLSEMMEVYSDSGDGNVIAVYEVPRDQVYQYGIVGVGETRGQGFRITSMVEKPKPADAPSNYMISGRYILQPEIFTLLERQSAGAGGEIQVTDAMLKLAQQQPFFGYKFEGRIFDCGSKIGFLAANVAYALARPDIAPAFRAELKDLMGNA
jgi:UTP--glucose-1-phosphate uridylyltransferase